MHDKIELIEEGKDRFGLNQCCAALGVSKSSYYWARRTLEEDPEEQLLQEAIVEVLQEHPDYGRRRLTPELNDRLDFVVNEKRVRRLLKDKELSLKQSAAKPPASPIRKTLSQHQGKLNLVRGKDFGPLQVASCDFTELVFSSARRKAYLIALVDIVSKVCLGWALGESANTELALQAWQMTSEFLHKQQQPLEGFMVHQDQDSVFTSHRWVRALLLEHDVRLSYSEAGAKDNPWIESFWSRFKAENHSLITEAQHFEDLQNIVQQQILYYNFNRRHSSIDYMTPMEALTHMTQTED